MPTTKECSDFIDTWSGTKFFPLRPNVSDINIGDIAASLSNQCRFGGHTRVFYSVARHSVHVSELVAHEGPVAALWGLLHDSAEAYLLDLPRPIKNSPGMEGYRRAESKLLCAIAQAFSLPCDLPPSIQHADEIMLVTEARDLMHAAIELPARVSHAALPSTLSPWGPRLARRRFLEKFGDVQHQLRAVGDAAPSDTALRSARL